MRICLCAAGAALALACGPIGPIPGGALRGDPVAEPVQDWSFLDAEHTVQLETRPGDPYSVNVWIGQQQHPGPQAAHPQLPCHNETIAAVVAFAAQDGDAMPGQRPEAFLQHADHADAGVLHQQDARNPQLLDGDAVHFPHLRSSQYLHFYSVAGNCQVSGFRCWPAGVKCFYWSDWATRLNQQAESLTVG